MSRRMSTATAPSAAAGGNIAHVNFRVRCETLGHGEDVFLCRDVDVDSMQNLVPLYTTAAAYPWYHTIHPVALPCSPGNPGKGSDPSLISDTDIAYAMASASLNNDLQPPTPTVQSFLYKYAVFRAGSFHRWEDISDVPQELLENKEEEKQMATDGDEDASKFHDVPLRLLATRESYIVNDVLGLTDSPHPDIDHLRVPIRGGKTSKRSSVSTLHSRDGSRNPASFGSLAAVGTPGSNSALSAAAASTASIGTKTQRKKVVGFAPPPPPYHPQTYAQPSAVKSTSSIPTAPSPNSISGGQSVHLNSNDGLVVVSAFLPIILNRDDESGAWSADWDYEILLSMQTHLRVTRVGSVKWRGWHGHTGTDGSPEMGVPVSERANVEACLLPFNCVPVWIEPRLFGEMYNGFCKGVLWPVMHNLTSVYSTAPEMDRSEGRNADSNVNRSDDQFSEYTMDDVEQGPIHGGRGREADLWTAYNTVNRKFADVVVQCFNEGDLVWIHGFHLLILPSYLTRRIPMAKVGIFLHTPFPSSEIFRTVWCREDLLRGMLNADQIGFHLFEYARHFLTCCRRLLGLNYGMIPDASGGHTLAIETNGRHVSVTSIHAGVEPPVLSQILSHESTLQQAHVIRSRNLGKTIFCAIDRLESLKGIPLKLLGLERFLRRCPEWVGKIMLIQIGVSAYERGDDYVRTKKEVHEIVDKINNIWPGTIQFEERSESSMRLQERMALLRAADVVLVTPIRDGLNLTPLEYTMAHQDALTPRGKRDNRKRGLCILSEFSSCTRVMRGALHVNPWKISEIANAFYQSLHMPEDERMRRISIASEFVTRVTTQRWALAVMLDLKGVHKSVNPVQYSGAGLGLGYRLLGMDIGFSSLDFNRTVKAFKNSRSRLILMDYGGTIASNDNLDNLTRFQMVKDRKSHSEPSSDMIKAIKELCADPKNNVFVVSGKERHSLTKTLGNIPNLGLAAEHGMYISWPTTTVERRRQWETLVPITDRTWRSIAMSIMEVYASRTHGSYIEETEMKVLWQYRDADLEFGYLQARELEDHLAKYLRGYSVDILHGGMEEGGYVEVRPKGVNKGVLAMKVIKHFPTIAQRQNIEFALVLGDDHCDEPMLSVMRQIGRRVQDTKRAKNGEDPLPELPSTITLVDVSSCDKFLSPDLNVFTCTVGKKPSAAATYLQDVDEVQELLNALIKVSTRDQKHYSSIDLRTFAMDRISPAGKSQRSASEGNSSMGMPKSMSLGQMAFSGTSSLGASSRQGVSSSLTEYMNKNMGTIHDDAGEESDDDGMFF